MNKRLRMMKEEIERRGGLVHIAPELPNDVAELFLREILDCPDCLAEARKARSAGDARRKSDH